jgi:septal ring factor EnvC (AmiA/AmiB activator)
MPRFSVTFDDEDDAYLADLAADDAPYSSKAEAVRAIVSEHRQGTNDEPETIRQDYERKLTELETAKNEEIEDLESEINRLNRERRQLLEQREENNELVRYAQSEREAVERREKRRQANMFRRAWWYLAGAPEDEMTE